MAETESDEKQTSETKTVSPVEPAKKSSNKTLIIVLTVVAVLFILPGIIFGGAMLWLSKGDNAEKLAENFVETTTDSTNVDINTDDNSFSIESEEGSISAQSGNKLADDFPGAVVLYDTQAITGTFNQSSDSQQSWSVTAETSASPTEVGAFFEDKYKDWENAGTYGTDTMKSYSFKQGTLSVYISVTKDEGDEKTTLNYTVNQETQ